MWLWSAPLSAAWWSWSGQLRPRIRRHRCQERNRGHCREVRADVSRCRRVSQPDRWGSRGQVEVGATHPLRVGVDVVSRLAAHGPKTGEGQLGTPVVLGAARREPGVVVVDRGRTDGTIAYGDVALLPSAGDAAEGREDGVVGRDVVPHCVAAGRRALDVDAGRAVAVDGVLHGLRALHVAYVDTVIAVAGEHVVGDQSGVAAAVVLDAGIL